MPPKGSTKAQAKEQTKTPQKTKADAKPAATPTKTPAKQTPKKESKKEEEAKPPVTPKKAKAVAKYTQLVRNPQATLPIGVVYQGDVAQAKQVKANYTHVLKLDAGAPFTLVDTYLIPEGQQYEGHQLILLKPAQAFKFLKLPKEIRGRIYNFLFFTKGQGSQPITIDGKRKDDSKDPYAKSFAEGSKMRVAILRVNKEINEEATPVLYARPIRFDTPSTLMTFFANLESSFRPYLRHIELRQYVKKDAKTALVFLSEAKGLEHLRIELGVANEDDADKAALAFWSDVCKLLDVVGSRIAKSKVPPRKIKLPEAKVEEEESEEDEESEEEEEEEDEEEDEDESEDNETEKTDESIKSDPIEAKDSKDEVTKSDDSKDAEVAKSEDSKEAESAKVEGSETGDHKPADVRTEEDTTADGIEKPSDPAKTDSKSPVPVVHVVKKKPTAPEPPQLIQGQKCFAVDILNFGKSAFKNKNGTLWDNNKKQKFLTILEGKLNAAHLTLWACICGTSVNGHSCSAELQAKGKRVADMMLRTEFEHLGYGGAELINETFEMVC